MNSGHAQSCTAFFHQEKISQDCRNLEWHKINIGNVIFKTGVKNNPREHVAISISLSLNLQSVRRQSQTDSKQLSVAAKGFENRCGLKSLVVLFICYVALGKLPNFPVCCTLYASPYSLPFSSKAVIICICMQKYWVQGV